MHAQVVQWLSGDECYTGLQKASGIAVNLVVRVGILNSLGSVRDMAPESDISGPYKSVLGLNV